MNDRTSTLSALVIEDHPVTRLGITAILQSIAAIDTIAEAETVAEARRSLVERRHRLVVLDLSLPDGDGLDLVREIRGQNPDTCLVVLTMRDATEVERAARGAGADDFVTKTQARQSLAGTVARALAARGLLGSKPRRSDNPGALSKRELEVLALVVRGHTNAVIGEKLGISWTTVRTHVVHVLDKLGARDRTEAATMAIQLGLLRRDNRLESFDEPS